MCQNSMRCAVQKSIVSGLLWPTRSEGVATGAIVRAQSPTDCLSSPRCHRFRWIDSCRAVCKVVCDGNHVQSPSKVSHDARAHGAPWRFSVINRQVHLRAVRNNPASGSGSVCRCGGQRQTICIQNVPPQSETARRRHPPQGKHSCRAGNSMTK